MEISHHGARALVEHVRVDLRRRNVGVAEQLLYDAQIRPVLEKMTGEGVSQHVRADEIGPKPPIR